MKQPLKRPTAMIADDEPLLREALTKQLKQVWPELEIVAQARNGREAVELFYLHKPNVCFLDVHMPGISGIEAAKQIGQNSHLVFVTAYDQYAIQAFEQGVLDYLVKPVDQSRLLETVSRLQQRLSSTLPPEVDTINLLQQLAHSLQGQDASTPLRWLKVQSGKTLRLISVDDIDFFRADHKYTLVAWKDSGKPAEALIRTPLKELVTQLDVNKFKQIHRSVLVNLHAISHIMHGDNETAQVYIKNRDDVLPVSRSYLHLFKQM